MEKHSLLRNANSTLAKKVLTGFYRLNYPCPNLPVKVIAEEECQFTWQKLEVSSAGAFMEIWNVMGMARFSYQTATANYGCICI